MSWRKALDIGFSPTERSEERTPFPVIYKICSSFITKPFLVHYLAAPSGNPKANLQVSLSLRRTQPREGKQVAGVPARALKPKALGQMGSLGTAERVSVS